MIKWVKCSNPKLDWFYGCIPSNGNVQDVLCIILYTFPYNSACILGFFRNIGISTKIEFKIVSLWVYIIFVLDRMGCKWGFRGYIFTELEIVSDLKILQLLLCHISICIFMSLSFIKQLGSTFLTLCDAWTVMHLCKKKKKKGEKPPDSLEIRLWYRPEQRQTR